MWLLLRIRMFSLVSEMVFTLRLRFEFLRLAYVRIQSINPSLSFFMSSTHLNRGADHICQLKETTTTHAYVQRSTKRHRLAMGKVKC